MPLYEKLGMRKREASAGVVRRLWRWLRDRWLWLKWFNQNY